MAINVLDKYYLAITLLVTLGYQSFFFAIAWTFKFDKVTDLAGGTNFIILAILTLACSAARDNARNIVTSVFLMVWGARLSGFLFFRILKTGKDNRFDEMREKFISFLGFWTLQFLWVWVVSLPVTVLNSPGVTRFGQPKFGTGLDIAGVIIFTIGFTMESVSDAQKYRFRTKHGSADAICDVGFFKWTRHPNYFGEIIVQFAIFMICVSPAAHNYTQGGAKRALYATILSPIFITTLLMFISGLNLQERPAAKKRYEKGTNWPAYEQYIYRTSILIPFPPFLYAKLPVFLKRTIFLEFPMYAFDPNKHSDKKNISSAEEGRITHRDSE